MLRIDNITINLKAAKSWKKSDWTKLAKGKLTKTSLDEGWELIKKARGAK